MKITDEMVERAAFEIFSMYPFSAWKDIYGAKPAMRAALEAAIRSALVEA